MTVTVDTSAIIAVASDEPAKPALIEAVRGHDIVAPASLPAEVGNALSAMLKRERITSTSAMPSNSPLASASMPTTRTCSPVR